MALLVLVTEKKIRDRQHGKRYASPPTRRRPQHATDRTMMGSTTETTPSSLLMPHPLNRSIFLCIFLSMNSPRRDQSLCTNQEARELDRVASARNVG